LIFFDAIFGLVRMTLSGLTGLVIAYAVLSWVQTRSPVSELLERLVMPILNPIRRVVPLVGGVDLSPLVLLVLLQIAAIVLGPIQAALLVAL
jgi:YggT family protein